MTPSSVRLEHRDDGRTILVLDAPGRSANTMDEAYWDGMDAALAELRLTAGLRGVVVTSAKKTFFAGGDLRMLRDVSPDDAPAMTAFVNRVKNQLRDLETLGVPVVAAINGAALGGGLEIALACHGRIAIDAPGVRVGLPEVTLGILPAANGLTRTVRLLGARAALSKLLLTGESYSARQALEMGLIDDVVMTQDELLPRALKWLADNPDARAPWDVPGFRVPESELEPERDAVIHDLAPAARRTLTGYPMPAPHAIADVAIRGAAESFDTASEAESIAFVELVTGQVATNLIQSRFFDVQTIKSGGSRPDGIERFSPTRVAVIGAGMMGAGIAQVCAEGGVDVVLVDIDEAFARRGLDTIRQGLEKRLGAGADAIYRILDRIQATGNIADVAGCDVVIEAVLEDPDLKAQVFKEVASVVGPEALLASNTSTLPIDGLADALDDPSRLVGLHFFSPVPRMDLVEVIAGARTTAESLARGIDVARWMKKLPIVVSDSRGFFTSRVILTRLLEAMAMVAEGIDPHRIERMAVAAGYPVGPLALLDELTISLVHTVRTQARAAAGADVPWLDHPGDAVAEAMVLENRRPGRAAGQGFYDYVGGNRAELWPGLDDYRAGGEDNIDDRGIADRLLFAEAVDTLRCLDEGVLRSTADANVGSLLGIGYPTWTGGCIQFVAGYPGGVTAFEARADELAGLYGPRFALPPTWTDHVGGALHD